MASSSSSSKPRPARPLAAGECTAKDDDVECDCVEFSELQNTGICEECFHARKYHLEKESEAGKETKQRVQNILTGIIGSSGSKGSSSSTLAKIGKAQVARRSSRSAQAANAESNRGMRPSTSAKSKGKV